MTVKGLLTILVVGAVCSIFLLAALLAIIVVKLFKKQKNTVSAAEHNRLLRDYNEMVRAYNRVEEDFQILQSIKMGRVNIERQKEPKKCVDVDSGGDIVPSDGVVDWRNEDV